MKHHFVVKDMIHTCVRFPMFEASTMYEKKKRAFSLFVGFILAQDH